MNKYSFHKYNLKDNKFNYHLVKPLKIRDRKNYFTK